MHGPMSQESAQNSWKLKMSQFFHSLHVWDALDRRVRLCSNIQQLHTAIEEQDNIPQATINSLINSMRRRCAALHEANVGHTRY
jgi:hypothetical protein